MVTMNVVSRRPRWAPYSTGRMRRSFWIGVLVCLAAAAAGYATALVLARDAEVIVAPAGAEVDRVWHLGQVPGDLDRVITATEDIPGIPERAGPAGGSYDGLGTGRWTGSSSAQG